MAATVISVQTITANSGSSLSPSVTVPSGTTAVYLFVAAYGASDIGMSASTLGGNAADASSSSSNGGDNFNVFIREFRSPSIGAQTLALTFNQTISELIGVLFYVQGGVLTGWRSVGTASYLNTGAVALTTVADDLVLALDTRFFSPAPGNQSGWTSHATPSISDTYGRARSIVASGTSTTATSQNSSFSAIGALAVAPGSAPATITGSGGATL